MSTRSEIAFDIFIGYTITTIALCSCIFIPISIYSLRKLWVLSDNLIFKKRQSTVTILFVIFGILNFILLNMIFIARIFATNRMNGFGPSLSTHIFIQYCLTFIVIICIFLCRVYINYFDINYSKTIINNEWKSLINTNINKTQNWFILHKNSYGSAKYWAKYIILIYIVSLCILYVYILFKCDCTILNLHSCLSSIHNNISQRGEISLIWTSLNTVTILIVLPGIILLTIIRYKTPTFEDNFFVKTEINYILISALVSVPLNIPCIISAYFINNFWIKHIFVSIPCLIYAFCIFGIILIHTLWPIKRNKHWLLLFELQNKKKDNNTSPRTAVQLSPLDIFKNSGKLSTFKLSQMRDNVVHSNSFGSVVNTDINSNDLTSSSNVLLEMDTILATEQGFGAFMFHLSTEFSVEILLSLIEFIQYKVYMVDNGIYMDFINVDIADEREKYLEKYGILFKQKELIQNGVIPQSQLVVENTFNNKQFHDKYDSVYRQYLEVLKINDNDDMLWFKLLFECMVGSYYLFCKYIDVNAATEINIGFSTRSQLTDIFGGNYNGSDDAQLLEYIERRINERLLLNVEMETLLLHETTTFYQIFDESADEMIKLLTFSFVRFKETSLYKKLVSDTH